MRVLVAYATRHGATAGIAERIATRLSAAGLAAEAVSVENVHSLEGFQAVVLGAATYLGRWLKPAVSFARTHRDDLSARPLWLFASGPLGTDLVDDSGRDVLESTRPREFEGLTASLHPRGERVFFGAFDPAEKPVGLGERVVRAMPAMKGALPTGDFRDWDAIDAWAAQIAEKLQADSARAGSGEEGESP